MSKSNMTISQLCDLLFLKKSDSGFIQLFRYLFVGGFSALVDIGSLFIFTSVFHIHYLISAFLAFILGTIVNYLLSIWWIFKPTGKRKTEITLFTLIGFGGLLLNEFILWVSVEKLGFFYLFGKFISVALVLVWSFTLRRLLFRRLAQSKTVG